MNVLSRTTKAERSLRRPLRGRQRASAEGYPRTLDPEVHIAATAVCEQADQAEVESDLDEATYTCGCGYVFQAAVVTSVDCPHCGDAQAW